MERTRSWVWLLFPVFLGIIGSAIAYYAIRRDEPRMAKDCLYIGIVLSGVTLISVFASVGLAFTDGVMGGLDSGVSASIDDCLKDSESFDGSVDLSAFGRCVDGIQTGVMP